MFHVFSGKLPLCTQNISQVTARKIRPGKRKRGSEEQDKSYLFHHPVIIATGAFRFPGFAVAFLEDKHD